MLLAENVQYLQSTERTAFKVPIKELFILYDNKPKPFEMKYRVEELLIYHMVFEDIYEDIVLILYKNHFSFQSLFSSLYGMRFYARGNLFFT